MSRLFVPNNRHVSNNLVPLLSCLQHSCYYWKQTKLRHEIVEKRELVLKRTRTERNKTRELWFLKNDSSTKLAVHLKIFDFLDYMCLNLFIFIFKMSSNKFTDRINFITNDRRSPIIFEASPISVNLLQNDNTDSDEIIKVFFWIVFYLFRIRALQNKSSKNWMEKPLIFIFNLVERNCSLVNDSKLIQFFSYITFWNTSLLRSIYERHFTILRSSSFKKKHFEPDWEFSFYPRTSKKFKNLSGLLVYWS